MEYISVARKAKGTDNWFVGGVTGKQAHRSDITFHFLDKGRKYEATIYRDGTDADYKTRPQSYKIEKLTVTAKTKLSINSVPGGGYAISLIAK